MSHTVPDSPPLPRRWPHWYALLSLAFHGWVIWRGTAILRYRDSRGGFNSLGAWAASVQILNLRALCWSQNENGPPNGGRRNRRSR
ncbi:MAG TPA: hypothetical protein VD886_08750 [Herpetosiphonaceae bacterium]|nr:hypothetical protein [Herpetosiphonaceae bacterium]